MRPTDVARPAPPVLTQTVEPAVVADAERGIRLDIVSPVLTETGPTVEEPRPTRDDRRNRTTSIGGRLCERVIERRDRVRRFRVEHRFGWAGARERHGSRFRHCRK